jgi:DNA-binding MarR family transcriptional regulator
MNEMETKTLIAARDVGISSIIFRNFLAKHLKLGLSESLCLTLLSINNKLSPSKLSKIIGISTGSTTTMIDRLERKNMIKRKNNDKDRRGIEIELTEKYKTDSMLLVKNIQRSHKKLISSYTQEELKVIEDFLRKFTRNLIENSNDVREVLEKESPIL